MRLKEKVLKVFFMLYSKIPTEYTIKIIFIKDPASFCGLPSFEIRLTQMEELSDHIIQTNIKVKNKTKLKL
jgi:hypothetical protein